MNSLLRRFGFALLFGLSVSFLTAAQSVNYNQNLFDLISAKKWFEVERYYQQNKDSIHHEYVKLLYLAETGSVFNNFAQSIDAYEQLLDKNVLNTDPITQIAQFGQPLVNVCVSHQKFSEGERLCKKMMVLLQKDTSETAASLIRDFETIIQQFKRWNIQYPIPEIVDKDPNSIGEVALTPETSGHGIRFNAQWNGVNLRTIFDTGAGSCFIVNKAIAEKIGLKLNTADTLMVNGGNIRNLVGIVDSLTFGNFVIKNVPVGVNIDGIDSTNAVQTACDSIFNSMFDIILGMPVIKQLGVVEFDFEENTMSFPRGSLTSNRRNIYISNNPSVGFAGTLYLDMKIADDNFLTFFDTGGHEGLSIYSDFYEKHQQQLSLESEAELVEGSFGGCNDKSLTARSMYPCPEIEVQINDQKITLINDCLVAKEKENDGKLGTAEGGFLGNVFFKYCKKAVFDFNRMEFSFDLKSTAAK